MSDPLLIIGSGVAAYTLAREWRKLDADTPLLIISADDGGSYSKPMLSNALDKGKTADDLLMADAGKMAETLNATIQTHTRVTAINPEKRTISTEHGEIAYRDLVLALGADPIRIPFAGDAADAILSVNDRNDYARFREALQGARSVAIIGAGLIGCEFANDLHKAGISSHVIDLAHRALHNLVPEAVSDALQQTLAGIGISWHLGTTITSVNPADNGYRVVLDNGTQLDVDVVLSAIGLRPRTELAAAAGLDTNRGIRVDRLLQSSNEHIYAVGDCAEVDGLVLPFIMPLMNGARALAATLAGNPTRVSYPAMPVAVKTPDFPLITCPPRDETGGSWNIEKRDEGLYGLFSNDDGRLLGFCLTGDCTRERAALAREVPGWLD